MNRADQTAGDTVVFLGPSLRADEARRSLRAHYLGPVKCGDILRIRRMKPRAIGIVDGLFESTSAVWHKEILLAIEDGIAVFGASSMGALRAAELAPFGMVGIGAIFEAYRDGIYTDDDEVALLHAPAAFDYAATSDAMVNIRATVAKAVRAGAISALSAQRVIDCAKRTFYQERSLGAAADQAWGDDGNSDEARRFRQFVEHGGYVDQKRLDALALVAHLAQLPRALRRDGDTARVHRSYFIRRLDYEVACEAVDEDDAGLPREERVAHQARTLGAGYALLRRLAQLLSVAHALAQVEGVTPTAEDIAGVYRRDDFGLGPTARSARWGRVMDIDAAGRTALTNGLALIRALIRQSGRRLERRQHRRHYETSLLGHLRLDGRYPSLRPHRGGRGPSVDRAVIRQLASRHAVEFRLYRRIATLWDVVVAFVDRSDITIPGSPQALSDEFRERRGLHSRAATLGWQRASNLTHRQYVDLVTLSAQLSVLTDGSHAYWLGLLHDSGPAFRLLDAIRLSGLYAPLKRRLLVPS